MFSILFSLACSYKVQIPAGKSITITTKAGYVLIPVDPTPFIGEYGTSSFFGSTGVYVLNFSDTASITVKNPNADNKDFEYQIFKRDYCSATEIWVNPPNGHYFKVSATSDYNTTMVDRQKLCFWYVIDSSIISTYSLSLESSGLSDDDDFTYSQDVEIKNFTRVSSNGATVYPTTKSAFAIEFETGPFYHYGEASYTFSTTASSFKSLNPQLSNSVCITRTYGQCTWITLSRFNDLINFLPDVIGLSIAAIVGIVIACLIVLIIIIIASCVCCCGVHIACCCCCLEGCTRKTVVVHPTPHNVELITVNTTQPQYYPQQQQQAQYYQQQQPLGQNQYYQQQYYQDQK